MVLPNGIFCFIYKLVKELNSVEISKVLQMITEGTECCWKFLNIL